MTKTYYSCLTYLRSLFDELEMGNKERKTITIFKESFDFLKNLSLEMTFKTKKKMQIAHVIKYLQVHYTEGKTQFEEYQDNFKEIRNTYNLSLRGPPNNGKHSSDRQLYIDEIKEMKPSDVMHILPNISTSNLSIQALYIKS